MIMWAVTDFATFLPDSYYSLYVEALGASAFWIGTILSVASLAMAFLYLAGGYWADRAGRKALIVSMSFSRALIFLIFAAAPSWQFILLGEVLLGISSMSQPALMAIIYDSLPAEKRGFGFSLSVWVGVTSILSPVVAGILYLQCGLVSGMRMAYVIVAVSWLISGLILLRLTETLKGEAKISIKEAMKQYPNAIRECVGVWKLVPRAMLNLLLVFTPATFFIRMCIPYYVLYANHVLGIEEFQWAILQTFYSSLFYCLILPIGKLVDVFGRKKPLILSSACFALSMILFLYSDFFKLCIFFALTAIGNALVFTAYPAMQADLTPKESRGKVLGFTNFLDCFLGSVAVFLGGFLYGFFPAMPFVLLLIVMTVTAVATFSLVKQPENRKN
jgi:MFS family permease